MRRGDWRRAAVLASCLALVPAVAGMPAVAAAAPDNPPPAQVGERVTGSIELEPFVIPLPPGEWQVYYAETSEAEDGQVVSRRLGLLALDGDRMLQEIYARADLTRDGRGFQAFPACRDPAYLAERLRVNRHTREQDCWHVRAESLVEQPDAGPRFQALARKADAENLFLPAATVGARFHFADRNALLRVSYAWNPDLMLRARTAEKVWLAADWSRGEVEADPRRQAVARIIQDWAEGWYERMLAAFRTGMAAPR